jgi:hypothetical protein
MVMQAAGLGMGVGRCSRQRRGVGVLAMPDARLHITRHVESVCEVPPGAGMLVCYDCLYPAWQLV